MNGNSFMKSSSRARSGRRTSGRNVGGGNSKGGMPSSLLHDCIEDTGPHREMAVDVPDTFVGRTKTSPRYPPPKPMSVSVIATSVFPTFHFQNSNTSHGLRKKVVTAQATAVGKPAPPPQDHLRIEEDGRLVFLNQTSQEDERRRWKKEEQIAREGEFFRSSLRKSRRIQALEESSIKLPCNGVVNIAYTGRDEDDESEGGLNESDTGFANSSGLANWASALAQQNYLFNSGIQKIIGLQDVTAALQRVQQQLKKNGHADQGVEADLAAVQILLLSPAFHSALTTYSKVQEVWCSGEPVLPSHLNVQQLVSECLTSLQQGQCGGWPEAVELVSLLSHYDVESLLYAHDRIAEASTISTTPLSGGHHETVLDYCMEYFNQTMPESSFISSTSLKSCSSAHSTSSSSHQPPDRTLKIIQLEKSNEPLGATLRNDGESVVVGRIVRGGVAERSDLLHEGDEILEVNGVEVCGKSLNDVCDLVGSMTGTITFLIVPVGTGQTSVVKELAGQIMPANLIVHLKAHFDYDPEDDLYIPCKELGISFMKGDILHVISQEDPNWWQAFREGEEDQTLAGLIPSQSFQQQREAVRQAMVIDTINIEIAISRASKAGTLLCARKQHKKKRTSSRSNYDKDEDEEIFTYEEVGLYYPRANHKRPIILIGPPNIGRKELREMLMQDSERFAPVIPHTSRPKEDTEINSQGYYFISRLQFEADIANRRFVEYGEYEKSYYGTTLNAIKAVVSAGKFCVLNLHPQSLKILKDSDLMPFVVFVAPPPLEKLRAKKREKGEAAKDNDLKEIIEKAWEMEKVYGHYFDMVIVNEDEERTCRQLLSEMNRLEREPQWVPAMWFDRNDYK